MHHLNNAQRVGVPLLALLGDMLRVRPVNAAEAQGFVHLQLDGVARVLCQRRMRAVYSHLTSGVRTRHNAALSLLTSITKRNKQLAWEVFRSFDFSLKELPALAAPRKGKNKHKSSNKDARKDDDEKDDEKDGEDDKNSKRNSDKPCDTDVWPGVDTISLPTRHCFVFFALALLETGDGALLRPVLAQRAVFGNALRHVASDPPQLATKILKTLRDVVLSPNGGVPPRLRAALCGDSTLEQMCAISGTDADPEDDESRAEACSLAHDVLSEVCLDPAHGVCPQSALGRWMPPEERTESDRGNVADRNKSDVSSSVKRSATLIRLLRKLRPTESIKHAELLLNICEQRPIIAALYLPHATYSLDPRPSVPWLAAAALLGEVAVCASVDPTPPHVPPDSPGDAEGTAFVKAAMPASMTKQGLTKGLTHTSGLVRHATLTLLLRVLCAVRRRVARLDECAAAAESTSGGEDGAYTSNAASAAFTALAQRARGAAVAVLPEPQALLAVLATKTPSTTDSGESGMNRIHALNALAEYCELVGPDALAEANIDPMKTLPAEPLELPPPELAATVGFLAAARGVPLGARRLGNAMSDNVDTNNGDEGAHQSTSTVCVSRASIAAAAGDAAAAATAAMRRATAAGDSGRGANSNAAPQGHVLAILRIAARAPVATIRRDAAAVAGAHVSSCCAFETLDTARIETGAWIANLPGNIADHVAGDAACSFLAEAASATARRPGADADAAVAALRGRFGERGAHRWPRIMRRSARWSQVSDDNDLDTAMDCTDVNDGSDSGASPVLPAGAVGEDLEFSGLTANALSACVKVLGSAKRSEDQKQAVASYVSSAVFDILTQQTDPVPLAGYVLDVLRDAPVDKAQSTTSADGKGDGKKKGGGGGGGDVSNAPTFQLDEYSTLVSLVAFAKVVVEGEEDVGSDGNVGNLENLKALQRFDNVGLSPAAVVAAALCTAGDTKNKKYNPPAVSVLDRADIADACRAAAAQTPAEEIPEAARRLAFWCAYASADADRRADSSDDAPERRGFVELLGACGTTLARAREVGEEHPEASASARRALLGSPALATGFLHRGAAFAASLTEIVLDDLKTGGLDAPGAPYAAAAAAAATSALISANDDDNNSTRVATALAAVPLAKHADARARKRLAEASASAWNFPGRDPAWRALAAEASAAMLSRLSSMGDSFEASADASEALSTAFAAALQLAATGNDAGGARASDAAAVALAAAKTTATQGTVRHLSLPPDFATVASACAALGRAVSITVAGEDSPSTARLAEALTSAHPAHCDRLLVLVAQALDGGASAMKLVPLLPAVRVALERKVAVAVHCSSTARDSNDIELHENATSADSTFPGIQRIDDAGTVSKATKSVAKAFGAFVGSYFSASFADETVVNAGALEAHAPGTLAAAHALCPLGSTTVSNLEQALLPPGGWWVTDAKDADGFVETRASAFCCATAARLLFGGDTTTVSESNTSSLASSTTAYATSLLSTLRVLTLVVPASAAARVKGSRGEPVGTSKTAVAASLERDIRIDLGALLDSRGEVIGTCVTPELVASAGGFTRAALRRRYPSSQPMLTLVRRVAAVLAQGAGNNDSAEVTAHLAAFARDAFERLASHSATARVLLHQDANVPLPKGVAAMATPLVSLLPATHEDDDTEGGEALGDTDGGDAFVDEEDDTDVGGDDTQVVDSNATARSTKLELVGALHALWVMHGDATDTLNDSNDDLTEPFSMEMESDAAGDDDGDELPPAHHAVWRAEQSALIPLFAAAHGATLSSCDRRIGALLLQMDVASGGGALREMGYLWGDAAAYLARTNATLRNSSGIDDPSGDISQDASRAFTRNEPSPESIAAALRAGAPPDARRCAATATRFPHARRSPAPTPALSHRSSLLDEPVIELERQGLVVEGDGAGVAPVHGYDPAWVLPFALAALNANSIEPRDFVAWGLASVAFAATASADETTRAVAFAVLCKLQEACDEATRPEAGYFRERAQLTALLKATRNGLNPDGPTGEVVGGKANDKNNDDENIKIVDAKSEIARLPTAVAVFCAEAATAALHPAGDTYTITQRAVHRRAALDGEALPVNFLGALNGSGGGGSGDKAENVSVVTASRSEARTLRVWVLRLLFVSLRGGPEDARLFRKAFAAEVLMSHRTASVSSDPYARQLALAVVARAASTPAAARALVEGSGLLAWLSSAVKTACRPSSFRVGEAAGARAAAAQTATKALVRLASAKGAFYGGPSGTACDFLSALRDVRCAISPLWATHTTADAATITACRACLLPALLLHAAVAKRLTRRLGEVLDVAETRWLCVAVDAYDLFLETQQPSNTSESTSSSKNKTLQENLRSAMLELVVCSSGSGRDVDGFGARSLPGMNNTEITNLSLAAGSALVEVTQWATIAAALASDEDKKQWSAKVLRWCTASLEQGGDTLVRAVASPNAGGAVAFASTLGALRDALSLTASADAAPSLATAQAALLRAVASHTDEENVAVGDSGAWRATRRGAYRELLGAGGALETLLGEVSRGNAVDADGNKLATSEIAVAAELAGTLLRCAFAGVPPVAFARHVGDASAGSNAFAFVKTWSKRTEWPTDEDEPWRLGDVLADAGLCCTPKKKHAPPSPAVRIPSKRRRVEV